MMKTRNFKHCALAWANIRLFTYEPRQNAGVTGLLCLPRRVLSLSLLIALLALHSVRGEQVELLVNGSFTNGVQGWKIWGVVSYGVSAELYAKPRILSGIAQTVERSDFTRDMSFSYRVTFVFHSEAGCPFLEVSVTAYMLDPGTMGERTVLLYSRRYYSETTRVTRSCDISVNLRENLRQDGRVDLTRLLLKQIRVVFEAGFEDIHAHAQSQVYVHYASLLMVKPPPPPTITTTQTSTTTTARWWIGEINWEKASNLIPVAAGIAAVLLILVALKRRRG